MAEGLHLIPMIKLNKAKACLDNEIFSIVVIGTDRTWVNRENTLMYQYMNTCIHQGILHATHKTTIGIHVTYQVLTYGATMSLFVNDNCKKTIIPRYNTSYTTYYIMSNGKYGTHIEYLFAVPMLRHFFLVRWFTGCGAPSVILAPFLQSDCRLLPIAHDPAGAFVALWPTSCTPRGNSLLFKL
jgi:hypothetical protein